jgi:hypothetical protein
VCGVVHLEAMKKNASPLLSGLSRFLSTFGWPRLKKHPSSFEGPRGMSCHVLDDWPQAIRNLTGELIEISVPEANEAFLLRHTLNIPAVNAIHSILHSRVARDSVADSSESKKGDFVLIAHLSNTSALHVHRQRLPNLIADVK